LQPAPVKRRCRIQELAGARGTRRKIAKRKIAKRRRYGRRRRLRNRPITNPFEQPRGFVQARDTGVFRAVLDQISNGLVQLVPHAADIRFRDMFRPRHRF
jgi:hypothetical protein